MDTERVCGCFHISQCYKAPKTLIKKRVNPIFVKDVFIVLKIKAIGNITFIYSAVTRQNMEIKAFEPLVPIFKIPRPKTLRS